MTVSSTDTKGGATRTRIVERAMQLVAASGLEGLTIGVLAADLGLSKSGLFAHFKSKEALQLEVLDRAAEHFSQAVFLPALKRDRGTPRLDALFQNWLKWMHSRDLPGGCVFLAAATEWDDREGPVRDSVVAWFRRLSDSLARAASIAVEEKQFRRNLDVEQFGFELHGILLKYHLESRLLRSREAKSRANTAYERLIADARA